MAFLTLEDLTGQIEVVVFSDLYQKKGGLATVDRMLILKGQVVKENDTTKILARDIEELSMGQFKEVILQLKDSSDVNKLESFQKQAKAFPGPIRVKVTIPVQGQVDGMPLKDTRVTVDSEMSIRMQPELLAWVEGQFGENALKFVS